MKTAIERYHHLDGSASSAHSISTKLNSIALVLISLLIASFSFSATAQQTKLRADTFSVKISFKQGRTEFLPQYMGNDSSLQQFTDAIQRFSSRDTIINIVGYASPEGSHRFNEYLSRERANVLSRYMQDHMGIPAKNITTSPIGVDWPELYDALLNDESVPMRTEILDIIRTIPDYDENGHWVGHRTRQLKQLDGGRPWNYMLNNIYPYLRGASTELVCYVEMPQPAAAVAPAPVEIEESEPTMSLVPIPMPLLKHKHKHPYVAIHTNMLYDAVAIPNIGAEIYLGSNISFATDWWYAWWKTDRKHRYWRTYGGYVAFRYWIGKAAHEKPLTGHHIGIYGQALLYDFEWGGTGYLSGTPGMNINHHPTVAAGLEYGYSLPISRRLNIDFTIGLGYMQGRYVKYDPMEDFYVEKSIHNLKWFGPTKVEVSLAWLLGKKNFNADKRKGVKHETL